MIPIKLQRGIGYFLYTGSERKSLRFVKRRARVEHTRKLISIRNTCWQSGGIVFPLPTDRKDEVKRAGDLIYVFLIYVFLRTNALTFRIPQWCGGFAISGEKRGCYCRSLVDKAIKILTPQLTQKRKENRQERLQEKRERSCFDKDWALNEGWLYCL